MQNLHPKTAFGKKRHLSVLAGNRPPKDFFKQQRKKLHVFAILSLNNLSSLIRETPDLAAKGCTIRSLARRDTKCLNWVFFSGNLSSGSFFVPSYCGCEHLFSRVKTLIHPLHDFSKKRIAHSYDRASATGRNTETRSVLGRVTPVRSATLSTLWNVCSGPRTDFDELLAECESCLPAAAF